jgi:hypothetical protein
MMIRNQSYSQSIGCEKLFERRTANLFQSRSVLDTKNRLSELQHLPLPELGEKTSDCLAGGPDGLSDLFVVQSQFDGQRSVASVVSPGIGRPGQEELGKPFCWVSRKT